MNDSAVSALLNKLTLSASCYAIHAAKYSFFSKKICLARLLKFYKIICYISLCIRKSSLEMWDLQIWVKFEYLGVRLLTDMFLGNLSWIFSQISWLFPCSKIEEWCELCNFLYQINNRANAYSKFGLMTDLFPSCAAFIVIVLMALIILSLTFRVPFESYVHLLIQTCERIADFFREWR